MSDLLKQSAIAYRELIPYSYHFALGKRGCLHHMSIRFPEAAYYHLAGFHSVGIAAIANKKSALQTVLAGRVTHEQIKRAGASLEDRWIGICLLKEIIESNRIVFHYRGHEQPGSMIKGDYLMLHGSIAYFISNSAPVSIFKQTNRRYEQGCPRYVTLQICQEEVATGEVKCLYQSPKYIEHSS